MALPALDRSGSFAKLLIEAFLKEDYSEPWVDAANPLAVAINPAAYTQTMGAVFNEDKSAGADAKPKTFNRPNEVTLQMELVIDGTGAVPGTAGRSVEQQIADFRRVAVQINPKTGSPHYLKLVWGTMVFKGRLQSLSVNYTLFNPDGSPLRAKLNASFSGPIADNEAKRGSARRGKAAELVTIQDGDTLPALCTRFYGNPLAYLMVARANGLDSVRSLSTGAKLLLPPLSELGL
jgi:phage tail protein X